MQGWRLGKIRGISIEINYTWLIMLALFTWLFSGMLQGPAPSAARYWIAGAVTSLCFVLSVFLHEMSHSLVALSLGVPVRRITLFIFGGVAQIEGEIHTPKGEFAMAAAGPALSVVLGGIFWGLAWLAEYPLGASALVVHTLGLLSQINLILAVFNLLPGLPLDGGRVLHSILWGATRNEFTATRVAGFLGQGLGILMMVYGGLSFFVPGGGMGLWTFFIGWLILSVARAEVRQAEAKQTLGDLKVGQVMYWPLLSLPGDLTLEQALAQARQRPQPFYPVVDAEGLPVGMLDQGGLRKTPPQQWATATVAQVMEPLQAGVETLPAEAPVMDALVRMTQQNREWLLVTGGDGRPLGLVTPHGIWAAAGGRGRPG